MQGLPTIPSLEATHAFPCHYTLKIIGANTDAFEASVVRVAGEVSGYPDAVRASSRPSSKGNHRAVTVEVYVQTAHQVQALYVAMRELDDVRMML